MQRGLQADVELDDGVVDGAVGLLAVALTHQFHGARAPVIVVVLVPDPDVCDLVDESGEGLGRWSCGLDVEVDVPPLVVGHPGDPTRLGHRLDPHSGRSVPQVLRADL